MPTLSSEVYHLADECGVTESDIDAWFDYHEARGWKGMKHTERSVKASLRTWGRNKATFAQAPKPPTLDEVLAWFKSKEDDESVADQQGLLFYSHYNAIGWRVNGQAVTSWVSLAIKWREK